MIRIDKEFESLIPPLSEEEFKQLEENCVREGIRDPLIVWPQEDGTDILIDGHNRWNISARHSGIPFRIERMTFSSREEAITWMVNNQLGRRNLHPLDQERLLSVKREMLEKQAKKRQGTRTDLDIREKFPKSERPRDVIGKEIGVSGRQADKLHEINQKASDETKQQIRDGKKSVNQAWIEIKERERKQADLSAKAHLEAAEDRHSDFKEAKTVSISEVAQDKKDIETIARGRCTEIYNAIKKILFVGASEFDYSIISEKTVSSDTFHRLRGEIVMAIATLERIKEQIGG